jgi:SRSO17 transposase
MAHRSEHHTNTTSLVLWYIYSHANFSRIPPRDMKVVLSQMKTPVVPKASPETLPELAAYLEPFAPLFRRSTSRASVQRYLTGLLTDLPRKNCDTIAAAVVGTSTERLQHLLTDATWDPQALDKQRVQSLVAQSPPQGLLVLDDTGLPKQGRGSVGVARQYSGTLGKVANCQVVVTAHYVADEPTSCAPVHWPLTAQLYLPEAWATDSARRTKVHVPSEVSLQTKPALALALVDQARAWGVPFAWVVADAGYGDNPTFLHGLDDRHVAYVVGSSSTFGVRLSAEVHATALGLPSHPRGRGQPKKPRPAPLYAAKAVLDTLPADRWQPITWREHDDVVLRKQFVAVRVHWATGGAQLSTSHHRVVTGPEGWLLGERPVPGDRGEVKWYYSNLPVDTTLQRLVELAHSRWPIEQFYEDAKGECGLDHYQGRRWDGLHRHLALVMMAYSFLARQRWMPALSAGFSPLWGAPLVPGNPSSGAPVALPRRCVMAHGNQPDCALPPQANLTK